MIFQICLDVAIVVLRMHVNARLWPQFGPWDIGVPGPATCASRLFFFFSGIVEVGRTTGWQAAHVSTRLLSVEQTLAGLRCRPDRSSGKLRSRLPGNAVRADSGVAFGVLT